MTEQEWLVSVDPQAMREYLLQATNTWRTRWVGWRQTRRFPVSERKWRLIDLASLGFLADRIVDPPSIRVLQKLLPLARRHAQNHLSAVDLQNARTTSLRLLLQLGTGLVNTQGQHLTPSLRAAICLVRLFSLTSDPLDLLQEQLIDRVRRWLETSDEDRERDRIYLARLADAIRDILGNPYQPRPMPPEWRMGHGGATLLLAREIHESGRYHEMPILGDALEEAGCDDPVILQHCRSGGEHHAGCWVIDSVLDRS